MHSIERSIRRRPRSRGSRRLRTLPNFPELHARLCAGVSCESVAKWLQEEMRACTDVTRAGLVSQLYRYRRTIPLTERQPKQPIKLYEKVEQFGHKVRTLDELVKLYEYQLVRMGKEIDVEDRQARINPRLSRELDRARDLLLDIAQLKGELGLIRPGQDELSGIEPPRSAGIIAILREKYGPNVDEKLVAFGRRLQEAVQRLSRERIDATPRLPGSPPSERDGERSPEIS